MQKTICWLIICLACCLTTQALASEITIWDKQAQGNGWYGTTEDQEVEYNAIKKQEWDLEGMFYDNGNLSIVGGWNFLGRKNVGSGDIFISTSGSALYGNDIIPQPITSDPITNSFGYNYVFDVDWENYANGMGNWSLLAIDETSLVKQTTDLFKGNPASYHSGGEWKASGTFSVSQVYGTGYEGNTHYMASGFDLTKIPGFDESFIAHFTQECGNDVIMGQVPEPATMLLLGMGLLGIGAIGRKLPLKAE